MRQHYRGSTRQEMERAGRALKRREYRCIYCSKPGTHDEMHHHQLDECQLRPGSTVKSPR